MWGVVCGFSSGGGGGGGDSAQLALLLLRSVSSYVEYSDCCLCASSIGGSTTAQNRFRCWCWCAEDREPASQPARSSLARDSTLTDCCCSMLPSLRLLFFSAFFFLSSPPNSSWGTAIAVAVVVAELYVFLRTGSSSSSSSSTFPVVFSSSACAPLFESRCLPSFLPFLLCTYNALSPLSLSLSLVPYRRIQVLLPSAGEADWPSTSASSSFASMLTHCSLPAPT